MFLKLRKFLLILSFLTLQKGYAEDCFIDLESAWQRVFSLAPVVAASDTEIAIREAEKRQVSLGPNPVAIVEAENIGISHPTDDVEPPQTTFALAQTLELGGKRRARREFASSQAESAFWEAQIARQDLYFQFITTFISVSIAQEKFTLAIQRQAIAEKFLEIVNTQLCAGKATPIQEKKSQLALKSAQFSANDARAQFEIAKKRLSSLWGSTCPDFETVLFDLFSYDCPPSEGDAIQGVFSLPDIARAQSHIFAASKNLRLQKINRIPDVTVSVGYRVFRDSNEHGWLVGAEMPIPFFNRNQGNVERALLEINQAEFEMCEIIRRFKERVLIVHEKLATAFEQSEMIKMGVLNDALDAFNLTEVSYQKGKLDYLELLDAQNTLFEIQEKYIDILGNYHLNRAELARLSGEYNFITKVL